MELVTNSREESVAMEGRNNNLESLEKRKNNGRKSVAIESPLHGRRMKPASQTSSLSCPPSRNSLTSAVRSISSGSKSPGTLKAFEHLIPMKPDAPPPVRSTPRPEYGGGIAPPVGQRITLDGKRGAKPKRGGRKIRRRTKVPVGTFLPGSTIPKFQENWTSRSTVMSTSNQGKSATEMMVDLGILRAKVSRLERDLISAKQDQARALAQVQVVRRRMSRKNNEVKERLVFTMSSLASAEEHASQVEDALRGERSRAEQYQEEMTNIEERARTSIALMKSICLREVKTAHALLDREKRAAADRAKEEVMSYCQRYLIENQLLRDQVEYLEGEMDEMMELGEAMQRQQHARAFSLSANDSQDGSRNRSPVIEHAQQTALRIEKRMQAEARRQKNLSVDLAKALAKQQELMALLEAAEDERERYMDLALLAEEGMHTVMRKQDEQALPGLWLKGGPVELLSNPVSPSRSRATSQADRNTTNESVVFSKHEESYPELQQIWGKLAEQGFGPLPSPDIHVNELHGKLQQKDKIFSDLVRLLHLPTDCKDFEVIGEVTRLLQANGQPVASVTDKENSDVHSLLVQRSRDALKARPKSKLKKKKTSMKKKTQKSKTDKPNIQSSDPPLSPVEETSHLPSNTTDGQGLNSDTQTEKTGSEMIVEDGAQNNDGFTDDASPPVENIVYRQRRRSTMPDVEKPSSANAKLGRPAMFKTVKFGVSNVVLSLYLHEQTASSTDQDTLYTVVANDTKRGLNVQMELTMEQIEAGLYQHPEIYTLPPKNARFQRAIFSRIKVEWFNINARSDFNSSRSAHNRSQSSLLASQNSSLRMDLSNKGGSASGRSSDQMNVLFTKGEGGVGEVITCSVLQEAQRLEEQSLTEYSGTGSVTPTISTKSHRDDEILAESGDRTPVATGKRQFNFSSIDSPNHPEEIESFHAVESPPTSKEHSKGSVSVDAPHVHVNDTQPEAFPPEESALNHSRPVSEISQVSQWGPWDSVSKAQTEYEEDENSFSQEYPVEGTALNNQVQEKAVLCLQTWWRGITMAIWYKYFVQQTTEAAAKKIQKLWRGKAARVWYKNATKGQIFEAVDLVRDQTEDSYSDFSVAPSSKRTSMNRSPACSSEYSNLPTSKRTSMNRSPAYSSEYSDMSTSKRTSINGSPAEDNL